MSLNTQETSVDSARLSGLTQRQACRVIDFHVIPEDESRLKNMGICVGRKIELLQIGDPLIVKVSGANVGIARRLASGIEVELGSSLESDSLSWPREESAKRDRPLEATSIA